MSIGIGLNIGKVYPGMQSGTASLTAGVEVVTFQRPFAVPPQILVQRLTVGTSTVTIIPSAITATQASFTGLEDVAAQGGSLVLTSATTSTSNFAWFAFIND